MRTAGTFNVLRWQTFACFILMVVGSLPGWAKAGGHAARGQESSAQKPNILVIIGDDVGWFNIGAYNRGMMSGKTPNLDNLATEGMMFTDSPRLQPYERQSSAQRLWVIR